MAYVVKPFVLLREWYELPEVVDRDLVDVGPENGCNTTGFVPKSFEIFDLHNYDLQFRDENWTNIR